MLTLITILKLLAEVALLALAGQWLLGLLAGAKREQNMFYQLLKIVANPMVKLVRWVTPKFVLDRHIPLAAFLLLIVLWLFLTMTKISMCLQAGVNVCK